MGVENNFNYGYPNQMQGRPQMTPQQPQRMPSPSFQSFANGQNASQHDNMLVCKFVDDPSRIMPMEIPQNGDPAFFISRDFSRIYAKAWNSRGTIDDVMYVPTKYSSPEEEARAKSEESLNAINERLNNIEKILSTFAETSPQPKQLPNPNTNKKFNKESE